MSLKRIFLACVIISGLVLAFTTIVQANDADKMEGPSCNPGGLWFGFPLGNPPAKVVSILPIDGGKKRYVVVAEDQKPEDTPFRGELLRVKKNQFKLWGMSYVTLAADTYGYMVISGTWNLTDCNNAEGNYLVSLYATDPFLDENATPLMSVPILNLYERMPMIEDSSDF